MPRKLGVTTAQRKSMLRNLSSDLLWYGKITTTEDRAKEVRSYTEKFRNQFQGQRSNRNRNQRRSEETCRKKKTHGFAFRPSGSKGIQGNEFRIQSKNERYQSPPHRKDLQRNRSQICGS